MFCTAYKQAQKNLLNCSHFPFGTDYFIGTVWTTPHPTKHEVDRKHPKQPLIHFVLSQTTQAKPHPAPWTHLREINKLPGYFLLLLTTASFFRCYKTPRPSQRPFLSAHAWSVYSVSGHPGDGTRRLLHATMCVLSQVCSDEECSEKAVLAHPWAFSVPELPQGWTASTVPGVLPEHLCMARTDQTNLWQTRQADVPKHLRSRQRCIYPSPLTPLHWPSPCFTMRVLFYSVNLKKTEFCFGFSFKAGLILFF